MKGETINLMESFIKGIPKAELHLHIEGTLEPEMMFKIAKRNSVKIRYKTVGEVMAAYSFRNLQDFLNVYYEGLSFQFSYEIRITPPVNIKYEECCGFLFELLKQLRSGEDLALS
jgi:adenosine deaminase